MIASGEQVYGGASELDGVASLLAKPKVAAEVADSVVLTPEEIAKADDLVRMCGPSGASVRCLFRGREYVVSCFSVGVRLYSFMLTDIHTDQRFDCGYNVETKSFADFEDKPCPEIGNFVKDFLSGYTLFRDAKGTDVVHEEV